MSTKDTLIKKLQDKTAKIAILGLGYVGLPLAVVFGEAGFHVTGVDPDSRKVDSLKWTQKVQEHAVGEFIESQYGARHTVPSA